ncbi:MAG: hypothetical protein ACYTFF_20775, partial [Planctomycetota bacterium]
AFTHSMLASEMGSKPYLILEMDAHTADAGVQTRLEAFLDIIGNYRQTQARGRRDRTFTPSRLVAGGRVARSNGEQVPLSDPRVKLYFPNFSRYHARSLTMAVRCLGLQAGEVLPLERSQLDEGLRYTSGRECLPLPVCIGQMLTVYDNRRPGEIAGFYMLRGGAPCVADAYKGYLERFIAERRLERGPWPITCHRRSSWLTCWSRSTRCSVSPGPRAAPTGSRSSGSSSWHPSDLSTSCMPSCRRSSTGWRRCRARETPGPARGSSSPATSSPASARSSWKASTTTTPGAGSSSSRST